MEKDVEIAANPKAALSFFWQGLGRQGRIDGAIENSAAVFEQATPEVGIAEA
jgi:pyridoxine/pyridoxamine 5'-phosphate oxidase